MGTLNFWKAQTTNNDICRMRRYSRNIFQWNKNKTESTKTTQGRPLLLSVTQERPMSGDECTLFTFSWAHVKGWVYTIHIFLLSVLNKTRRGGHTLQEIFHNFWKEGKEKSSYQKDLQIQNVTGLQHISFYGLVQQPKVWLLQNIILINTVGFWILDTQLQESIW